MDWYVGSTRTHGTLLSMFATLSIHQLTKLAPVLAFDAHVLSWSVDDNPPNEYTRHHIKESSFYGVDIWKLDMVVRLNPDRSSLHDNTTLNFDANSDPVGPSGNSNKDGIEMSLSGMVERGIWPGKKWEWMATQKKNLGMEEEVKGYSMAMPLFEQLQGWFDDTYKGSTDVFMMHNVVKKVIV